jgi:hypothetical protein
MFAAVRGLGRVHNVQLDGGFVQRREYGASFAFVDGGHVGEESPSVIHQEVGS